MSKSFIERLGLKEKSQVKAPIVLLMATSTAGKTTICDAILRRDRSEDGKFYGCKVWGSDQESERVLEVFESYLTGNENFEAIKDKFEGSKNRDRIYSAIAFGRFAIRNESGFHELRLVKMDGSPLDNEEEFDKNLAEFMEKTGSSYDEETIRILRKLVEENPDDFRGKATSVKGFIDRIIAVAATNSRQGIPTILDVVPDQRSADITELYLNGLRDLGPEFPVHVAVIHVPLNELTARMEERNRKAIIDGNLGNQRDGLFPHKQYGTIFGASDYLGDITRLSAKSINAAVEKFGEGKYNEFDPEKLGDLNKEETAVRIRDMDRERDFRAGRIEESLDIDEEDMKDYGAHKSKMAPVFASLRAGKELRDHVGFADGATTLDVRTKVAADAVYDHSTTPTAKIAGDIYDWISTKMEQAKASQRSEKQSFVEKMVARASVGKSWEI